MNYNIGLISDDLTRQSLEISNNIFNITPYNYKDILNNNKIDFVLIESSWNGYNNSWKYKIASYDKSPKNKNLINFIKCLFRSNYKLKKLTKYCKKIGIKTVFWNKEDSVHFNRFINSAKLCDIILTVDNTCIEKYKKLVKNTKIIDVLSFPIETKLHNPYNTNKNIKHSINFIGSYSKHIHPKRLATQNTFFELSSKYKINIDIYDRNSDRKSNNYRFPNNYDNINILPKIDYVQTAKIYKNYIASFNVNTIEDSDTMYSRRLIEIIACGCIAITNWTPAVEKYFKNYCIIFKNHQELEEIIKRISKNGVNNTDIENAKKGAEYIINNHTWDIALDKIYKLVKEM